MTAADPPLATVIVPVFRHQRYLERAIQSILALDYEPLEIVISDDASPDDAFDVLRRLVDAYDGPHRVLLGRNETNMSMGNYNKLMEQASARYIIVAHDDDLQRTDRVSRIMDVYLAHHVSMVTSNMVNIGVNGEEIGLANRQTGDRLIPVTELARRGWQNTQNGATLSWNREIFDRFGPLDIEGTARTSDWILPFRAALLDGIYYLDEPLVERRLHPNRRGLIGRAGDHEDINSVELASEGITQIAYMLRTLGTFQTSLPERASENAGIRESLLLRLEELAETLGRHRNRLHMSKLRMTWIERDLGPVAVWERDQAELKRLRAESQHLSAELEQPKAALKIQESLGEKWKQEATFSATKVAARISSTIARLLRAAARLSRWILGK